MNDSAPYYAHMTYNTNGDNRWYLRVYPETPKTVAVDYAYSAGTASSANSATWAGGISGQLCINGGSNEGTYGISLYRSGYDYLYGIKFTQTSNWGTHSYSSYGVSGDWATYFTMDNTAHRGWIFRTYGVGNVASISNDGHLTLTSNGVTSVIGSLNSSWIHFENSTGVSYYFNNNVYSNGNFYLYSDRHLKKNIQDIDKQSLNELFSVSNKLFKKFTWKSSNKDSYGLIAQAIEKYIPEAVTKGPKAKTISNDIAYAKIIAAIINEINNIKSFINYDNLRNKYEKSN